MQQCLRVLRAGRLDGAALGLKQRVQRATQNLRALEAEQALRAVGPVGHGAVGIDEEDAVVADGARHEPEALLAGVELGAALRHALFEVEVGVEDKVLGAAPLGDVDQLDEKAHGLPVLQVGQVMHLVVALQAVRIGAFGLVADGFPIERTGHARQHFGQHLGQQHAPELDADHLVGRQAIALGIRPVAEAAHQIGVVVGQARGRAVGDALQQTQPRNDLVLDLLARAHVHRHAARLHEAPAGVAHGLRDQLDREKTAVLAKQAQSQRRRPPAGLQLVQVFAQQLQLAFLAQARQRGEVGPAGVAGKPLELAALAAEPVKQRVVDGAHPKAAVQREQAARRVLPERANLVARVCARAR
jgi:hypothetical protein